MDKTVENLIDTTAMAEAITAYWLQHKTIDGCPFLTPEQVPKKSCFMKEVRINA